jgi:chemotaxis protein methyltransferase CheR
VSPAALAKAQRACYGAWSLRGEAAAAARPYLQRRGGEVVVEERIRRLVRFARLNLAEVVYPSAAAGVWGMDLILCRNVLIYFEPDAVQAAARRLHATLAPGGWLLTASTDPPLTGAAPFECVTTGDGVFYRRNGGTSPARSASDGLPPPFEIPYQPEAQARDRDRTPSLALQAGEKREANPGRTPSLALQAGADDPLAAARVALAHGHYAQVCELTRSRPADADAAVLHVRALANLDSSQAEQACAAATQRHPLSTELHYLHAVLLLALGRDDEAIGAVRRTLYLNRGLAAAHLTLAAILERRGDRRGAARACRNARDLCLARPADEEAALADGARAGELAAAAAARLERLEGPAGTGAV